MASSSKVRFLLLLASWCLCQGTASAQQAESKLGTPITTLPYNITAPGVYILNQDFQALSMASGVAIEITASDVVLDLNGHTLKNTASVTTSTAYGILAIDQSNVVVRNGKVQGFMTGVALVAANPTAALPSAYGNLVESMDVSECFSEGIALSGSSSIVRKSQVRQIGGSTVLGDQSGAYGIDLVGKSLRCLDCDVAWVGAGGVDGSSYGVYLAQTTDAVVAKNRLSDMQYGIFFGQGATGQMRSNLFSGLTEEDFVGGTDAGGNFVDSNNDGVDDDWELRYFHTVNVDLAALAANGTGLTILQCFQQGINPNDFYNGASVSVSVVEGNNQTAHANMPLFRALEVVVKDAAGTPIPSAPVTFNAAGGTFAATAQSTPSANSLSVRTDADGHASVKFWMPDAADGSTVLVPAVAPGNQAGGSVSASFAATVEPSPHTTAELGYQIKRFIQPSDLNATGGDMVLTGFNTAGMVTGYYSHNPDGKLHAFVWDEDQQSGTDLNTLLGADSSMTTCLSEAGYVAGIFWSAETVDSTVVYHQKGFVRRPDGTLVTFVAPVTYYPDPSLPGNSIAFVSAINNIGQVIGGWSDFSPPPGSILTPFQYWVVQGFIFDGSTALGNDTEVTVLDPLLNAPPISDGSVYFFTWPVAINDNSQVVGTVYSETLPDGPSATVSESLAFNWQNGSMTVVPVPSVPPAPGVTSPEYSALGLTINASGQVAGSYYYVPSDVGGLPGSGVGSFLATGNVSVRPDDLSSRGKTTPFALSESGKVTGTALADDGSLHLYGWQSSSGTTDLRSVSSYTDDLSFQPSSINHGGNVTGLSKDESGVAQVWLTRGTALYKVASVESPFAVNGMGGSRVIVNNRGVVACAGTDTSGNTGVFVMESVLDSDGNGLPDAWEWSYFGHQGLNPADLAARGDGLTILEAYQLGLDPSDFFGGKAPKLNIVSGQNQIGSPGGYAPSPLMVSVRDGLGLPLINAPVTFTVTSGSGLLQAKSSATPVSMAKVVTDGSGQAHLYLLLPTQTVPHILITVTCGSAQPVVFDEASTSGGGGGSGGGSNNPPFSPFAPSNVVATLNSDGSLDVSWENSGDFDSSQTIPVKVKMSDGSFITQTVSADQTSTHIAAPVQ